MQVCRVCHSAPFEANLWAFVGHRFDNETPIPETVRGSARSEKYD